MIWINSFQFILCFFFHFSTLKVLDFEKFSTLKIFRLWKFLDFEIFSTLKFFRLWKFLNFVIFSTLKFFRLWNFFNLKIFDFEKLPKKSSFKLPDTVFRFFFVKIYFWYPNKNLICQTFTRSTYQNLQKNYLETFIIFQTFFYDWHLYFLETLS